MARRCGEAVLAAISGAPNSPCRTPVEAPVPRASTTASRDATVLTAEWPGPGCRCLRLIS